MRVLLLVAFRNLVQARRRSLVLGTAIGSVAALLVLMLAVAAGISENLVKNATTLSAGHVVVGGFFKPAAGDAGAIVTGRTAVRKVVEEHTPGLVRVVERGRGWGKIVGPEGSLQVGLNGVDLAAEPDFASALMVSDGDVGGLGRPGTVVLFENHARRLGVTVGDVVTVQTETQGGRTNTADLTVAAICRDMGLLSNWVVFLPQPDLRKLYHLNDDATGALWVYIDNPDDAEAVMGTLREALAAAGYSLIEHESAPFWMKFETVTGEDWTGQRLDVTTWRDEVVFLTWVVTAFDSITVLLVSVLSVLIAIGITNAMWNAVRERTQEIGTMRAIGMRRSRVLVLFLAEATLLGLSSTSAGASFGAVAAWVVDAARIEVPFDAFRAILLSPTLHLAVRPGAFVFAIGFLSLFSGLAALVPALRAAGLRPIQALGYTA